MNKEMQNAVEQVIFETLMIAETEEARNQIIARHLARISSTLLNIISYSQEMGEKSIKILAGESND